MTLATRRALCAVMVFAVVQKENTIVMNDGEELDSWSVILNGHVEITRPDGTIEHLHMGDRSVTPLTQTTFTLAVLLGKRKMASRHNDRSPTNINVMCCSFGNHPPNISVLCYSLGTPPPI